MNLQYISTEQDLISIFDIDLPFQILCDQSSPGQQQSKNGQQNNFIFTSIRYIVQNGYIIPIGLIIQARQIELLAKIFQQTFDNGQVYLTRDIRFFKDLLSFQNIGIKKACDFDANEIAMSLYETIDEFYKSQDDPTYDYGFEIGLLVRNLGYQYIKNTILENKFKGTIFFVKNDDSNCLYAAIISAFIKKQTIIDRKHTFKIGDTTFLLPIDAFQQNRAMQSYLDKPKIQNLYFFTNLLIQNINKESDNLTDEEIIQRASKFLSVKIRKTTIEQTDHLRPSSDQDLLLVICQLHYNVIIDFKAYATIQKAIYKDYRYCYSHQCMYRSKVQCEQCVLIGEKQQKKFCRICNYTHIIPSNTKQYQCQECKSVIAYTPDAICIKHHNNKCKNFEQCEHCNKIHDKVRPCLQKLEFNKQYFKEGKLYAEQKSYVTWDIESLYQNVQDVNLQQKYSMQHMPFLVTWVINVYNKESNSYSQVDHFYDNNLLAREDKGVGNYILIIDELLLKFINHMQAIPKKYKVKDFYAHNSAAYDNYLLLAQIIQLDKQFETDYVISNNKLLQLKINNMDFKDSFRIMPSPLAKLNKNLALGLEVGKQPQSYTFLTRDIFDLYVQSGGKLRTIKELVDENILQHKHFDKLSADEFKQYVIDYSHFDFIDQYINYCIQDSFILSRALKNGLVFQQRNRASTSSTIQQHHLCL